MFNKVSILSVGYTNRDIEDAQCIRANCSSILIQTKRGLNIIVDTMTAWNGAFLQEALALHSIQPKDIHYVICTHGHSDHIGCNYLFTNAIQHIVGTCVSRDDHFFEWNPIQSYRLKINDNDDNDHDVTILHTPGHTLSCISVIIRNTNLAEVVGVCGDLFECEKDIWSEEIWLNAGSEDPKKQMSSRLKMIEMCTYIIPGHGNGFHVTNEMRNRLKQDFLQKYGDKSE